MSSSSDAKRAPNRAGCFRPVAVAPTYNNDQTLADILTRISTTDLPMIVVNDGSTDQTKDLLAKWAAENPNASLTVKSHPHNQGKAAALLTGFAEATQAGFTHAVTMDTDGQLDPEEIPTLLGTARNQPEALIIGWRDDTKPDYPSRSRLGRRLSNLAIRLESGAAVLDSQCGFRVYPLKLFDQVNARSDRFGFEAEIITLAAWAGCPIVNIPVTCRYFPAEQRISHFKPWQDTLRGIGLHGRLLCRRLLRPNQRGYHQPKQ